MRNSSSEISEQVKRQMNRPQIHEAWEKICLAQQGMSGFLNRPIMVL